MLADLDSALQRFVLKDPDVYLYQPAQITSSWEANILLADLDPFFKKIYTIKFEFCASYSIIITT